MNKFLDEVIKVKQDEVASLKRSGAHGAFKRQALTMPLPPSFHDALRVPRAEFAIIGEIKRASPSKGTIRADIDATAQATLYEQVGLSAISVLTDQKWFNGSHHDMLAAAQATPLPVLCKDFIIDPVQVYQARAFGASAVLLISELLDDDRLRGLIHVARELSIDPFVEAHSAEHVEKAVKSGARVIGINARDLQTFEVDLNVPRRLIHKLPEHVVRVAESGIKSHETLSSLADIGFDAFLIGEFLSEATDVEERVVELIGHD